MPRVRGKGALMSNRWLFKTEPSDYSFQKLQREGNTEWTGVKNPLALKYLRNVKKGDEILIYHTGDEKSVVGIARAVADAANDSVRVEAVKPLAKPVTLASIKTDPSFRDFALVRMARLSVMPVDASTWKRILQLP